MFTGIIQAVVSVRTVKERGECLAVRIEKPGRWKLALGQSIAIDGICSTVTRLGTADFEVEYMPETLKKTTAQSLRQGSRVNVERSLTLRDPIDGHLVSGHVDARGTVKSIVSQGKTKEFSIGVPKGLAKYVATKGSVTVNGVSLTVVRVMGNAFSVALIPYTLAQTNLGLVEKGGVVNVEVDTIARYVARMIGVDRDRGN